MASNRVLRAWAEMVRGLEIDIIAPQHGAAFQGRAMVERFIDWCAGLICGVDLVDDHWFQVPNGGVSAPALRKA
jgi:flavorubredoxin